MDTMGERISEKNKYFLLLLRQHFPLFVISVQSAMLRSANDIAATLRKILLNYFTATAWSCVCELGAE